MNKLTNCFLIAGLSWSFLAEASVLRHHPQNLFIKLKKGSRMVSSPLIKKSKKLLGRLYLVKSSNPSILEQELKSRSDIEYVQRDFFGLKRRLPKLERLQSSHQSHLALPMNTTFNDPRISRLWAFGPGGMNVTEAYQVLPPLKPEEVVVAVVDTGVDHKHEDLKDVMWVNQNEIPGDGIDNDQNGHIDDIHGINTLVRSKEGNPTPNTMASHWHGTHVAGTIAATQNNGLGIAGVAHNAKIMAIRAVPDETDELDSDIVEAFIYAAKNGAQIINCSFGKNHNEGGMVVRDVMDEIGKNYGVLVVAAAGNDEFNNNDINHVFPASFDSQNMLVVASTTVTGHLSNFTNVGAQTVDVAAPGSSIWSTVNNNQYGMTSGTSMATPHVSGVAAMIKGYFPHLSPVQIKEVIMESVTKASHYQGFMVSEGRVNLKTALEKAVSIQ